MALITSQQAAAILGMTDRRVRQFTEDGRLKIAQTIGGTHLYRDGDLQKIQKRKPGRKPAKRKPVNREPEK